MIDRQTVFEIHRLYDLGWRKQKIARKLRLSRPTVRKYIANPQPARNQKNPRASKLAPYKDRIKALIEQDPEVKAPVLMQHIRKEGFDGKITIVRDYLRTLRGQRPLRTFSDLYDVNRQVGSWLDTVANVRIHQTTGKRPVDRLADIRLRALSDLLPDCRETQTLKVYNDFAVRFDGNVYTAPPWAIGKHVTLKADQSTVTIFYQEKKIAVHNRCWQRGQRVETASHKEQVKKLKRKLWLDKDITAFSSLGQEAVEYLEAMARARQPLKKSVSKLLGLKEDYGAVSVIYAIKKALIYNAIGADYIENILYQEMTPKKHHPPVRLKKESLNNIRLSEPSLAEYDTHVIKRSKK
jgi:hypothetical protein